MKKLFKIMMTSGCVVGTGCKVRKTGIFIMTALIISCLSLTALVVAEATKADCEFCDDEFTCEDHRIVIPSGSVCFLAHTNYRDDYCKAPEEDCICKVDEYKCETCQELDCDCDGDGGKPEPYEHGVSFDNVINVFNRKSSTILSMCLFLQYCSMMIGINAYISGYF